MNIKKLFQISFKLFIINVLSYRLQSNKKENILKTYTGVFGKITGVFMKHSKFISFILLSVIIFSLSSCSDSDNNSEGDKNQHLNGVNENSIVAEVADEKITASELKFVFSHIRNVLEQDANLVGADKGQIKEFWESDVEGEKREDVVKRECLEDLIEIKILVSKAKEENVQLDELDNAEIDELLRQYIETNGGEHLAEITLQNSFGMTLEDYRKINEEFVLSSKYKKEATKKIEIDMEDLKKYYNDNIDEVEMVTIKYILILTETYLDEEPMTEEEIAKKRELAEDVLSMAKNGEDFDTLSEEYNEDPESRLYGNELTFSRKNAREDLKEWAFSADVGDLTLLEVPAGFMLLKVSEKHGFEFALEGIKQFLQQQEFEKNLEQWKREDFTINQELMDSLDMLE
jgi:foldase protein PrsA